MVAGSLLLVHMPALSVASRTFAWENRVWPVIRACHPRPVGMHFRSPGGLEISTHFKRNKNKCFEFVLSRSTSLKETARGNELQKLIAKGIRWYILFRIYCMSNLKFLIRHIYTYTYKTRNTKKIGNIRSYAVGAWREKLFASFWGSESHTRLSTNSKHPDTHSKQPATSNRPLMH